MAVDIDRKYTSCGVRQYVFTEYGSKQGGRKELTQSRNTLPQGKIADSLQRSVPLNRQRVGMAIMTVSSKGVFGCHGKSHA
jgi:hypothetical protein